MINLIIAIFEILMAIGIIGFWIYFFAVENKNPDHEEWYLKHERSFPLPDLGWVVPCLLIAAIGLLMDQRFGIFFTIAAGSGLMFLGFIDLLFDLQNGMFKKDVMSLIIVPLVLIFGVVFLIYGWINF